MRILPRHLKNAGICPMGVRRATSQLNSIGIDVARFFREGIPVDEIKDIDDYHIQKMIEVAKKEWGDNGKV